MGLLIPPHHIRYDIYTYLPPHQRAFLKYVIFLKLILLLTWPGAGSVRVHRNEQNDQSAEWNNKRRMRENKIA